MSESIIDVLKEENDLLACLIAAVAAFEPQTEVGKHLHGGWMTDLTEWKQSNDALAGMEHGDRKATLKLEKEQIGRLLGVAREFAPNSSSQWWKDYLGREEASAELLENLA